MKIHSRFGFTLIELLVVISIIGTLSSIVISSLNTARNKGIDSGVVQQLQEMRTAAENNYGSPGPLAHAFPYDNVCKATSEPGILFRKVADMTDGTLNAAFCTTNGTYYFFTDGNGSIGSTQKIPAAGTPKWAAAAKLRSGSYFCVDYSGNSTTTGALTISGLDQDC